MESTVKVTVVYESLFGNTRKVAQAISDGVRGAYPDAHVECVAVGRASAELISSTDLLIVGGPTHLCRMTTDFSRQRHISRAKKAEAKGEPPHQLEPDAEGPGLREWFYLMWPARGWSHAAAFDTSLGSALVGAGSGIARKLCGHGYELVRGPGLWDGPQLRGHGDELVTNPAGFILDSAFGPLRAGEIERAREWGLSWCGGASPTRKAGRSGTAWRATSSPNPRRRDFRWWPQRFYASDYDCRGGSRNGPKYTGPVRVTGSANWRSLPGVRAPESARCHQDRRPRGCATRVLGSVNDGNF
jgi:hypothetical protein